MTDKKMRDQFEAWWPTVGQTIGKVAAWEAWQAALASAGEGQEPVAYVDPHYGIQRTKEGIYLPVGAKLYTHPAPHPVADVCRHCEMEMPDGCGGFLHDEPGCRRITAYEAKQRGES